MSFRASNVVRRVAPAVDWTAAHFRATPELSVSVSAFRTWSASAEGLAEKYAAPPTPIDFASYGNVRDKSLVETLESFYKTFEPKAETYEWCADDKADKLQQIEDAKEQLSFTQDMLDETEQELTFMRDNRTTVDSDGSHVKDAYPDIAEETEKELEERKWFKDAIA